MHRENSRSPVVALLVLAALATSNSVRAQSADEEKLAHAADVLLGFTADEDKSIPADLLQRARGIAVIPSLVRGGFFIGGLVFSIALTEGLLRVIRLKLPLLFRLPYHLTLALFFPR